MNDQLDMKPGSQGTPPSHRTEQRRHPLYSIRLPLLHKAQSSGADRAEMGWTHNMGEGGACVEVSERLQPQGPIRVRLQTARGAIELEAKVVWSREPGSAGGGVLHGMAFTQIPPRAGRAFPGVTPLQGAGAPCWRPVAIESLRHMPAQGSGGTVVLGLDGRHWSGGTPAPPSGGPASRHETRGHASRTPGAAHGAGRGGLGRAGGKTEPRRAGQSRPSLYVPRSLALHGPRLLTRRAALGVVVSLVNGPQRPGTIARSNLPVCASSPRRIRRWIIQPGECFNRTD